jgi:hypothetical protein
MTTYKAATRKSRIFDKDYPSYYPVVKRWFGNIHDETWLNTPQPTRSKARTLAVKYIKDQQS